MLGILVQSSFIPMLTVRGPSTLWGRTKLSLDQAWVPRSTAALSHRSCLWLHMATQAMCLSKNLLVKAKKATAYSWKAGFIQMPVNSVIMFNISELVVTAWLHKCLLWQYGVHAVFWDCLVVLRSIAANRPNPCSVRANLTFLCRLKPAYINYLPQT